MELLISLLIVVLIIGIVYWAVNAIPLPPPVRIAAIVIIALIAIIVLLGYVPGLHLR